MDSRPAVSIGIQSFEKIRERNSFYVDKTGFIREWWEQGSDVTLITRPRRFGKTLNMSMLECFFSNRYAGKGGLFEGLSIWDEKYKALQGQYPVIYLSFASVKSAHFSGMVVNLADTYLLRSNRESGYGRYDVMLEPVDKEGKAFIFEFKVLDRDEDEETLEDTLAAAHRQIAEKKYETELVSRGFALEKIRSYGFAFRGKECLIG